VRAASVPHHDDTPARFCGHDADRLLDIYTARAGRLVWVPRRRQPRPRRAGRLAILSGYRGTLVRDNYPAYATYDKHLAAVQLCCARLQRALPGIGELDTDPYRIQRACTEPAAQALVDAKAAVAKTRADAASGLDPDLLAGLRARYQPAVAGPS
jgi:transposase